MMNDVATNTLEQRGKQARKTLFLWTLGWLVSLALIAFGPKFWWDFNKTVTLIAIVVNLIMGYRMIMVNKQYLDGLDELQRKLHMNAMAISLGVSMVFGAVYGLLEPIKLLESTPNPSNILFVMGISYLVSLVTSSRKYQ